ncbi:hypothetical protein Efla_004634 [Eimeria flavescens]
MTPAAPLRGSPSSPGGISRASGLGVLLRADRLSWGDEGTRVGGLLERLDSLPLRGFNSSLPGSNSTSQPPGQRSVPGAPGNLSRCAISCRSLGTSSWKPGDDQPSTPQQQVQEAIPNRLVRTQRPREDNLDSGMLEPSPPSAPLWPASSPGEQGPLGATEVPRLQDSPSPGVSEKERPPSSAEASPQESAGEELPATPPAPGGGAADAF